MGWRGLERFVQLATVVALLAVAPTPAGAKSWGAPQAAGEGTDVAVASDRLGNSLIGWADGKSVQVRTRTPDGTFGPVQTLAQAAPTTELRALDIAMDGDGNAVAAWIVVPARAPFQVAAATGAPGGRFGEPQTVASDVHGRNGFHLSVASGGWAALIWDHDAPPEYTEASIRPPGQAFGPAEKISPDRGTLDAPTIAIDAQGGAIAAWDNYSEGLAETATRPPQGPWGPTEALGPSRMASSWPGVALDDQGNALATLMADGPAGGPTIRARWRPAGGAFGSSEQVSQPVERRAITPVYFGPTPIGFDAAGTATVLWRDVDSNQMFASTRSRGGGFDGGAAVSDGAVDGARLAVAANGGALALWAPPSQTSVADAPRPLLAASREPGAGFAAPQQLEDGAVHFDVAADANGNGLAVWTVSYGGSCAQVLVEAYSDTPPPAAPGTPPKPVCAGGPSPEPPPAADTKPPVLKVAAARRQRSSRVRISLRCSEACTAVVTGSLRPKGRKPVALKTVKRKLGKGKPAEVAMRLPASVVRRLRSRPVLLAVKVTATDAARNRTTRRSTIRVTR